MRSIDTDAIKPETNCSEIPNKSDTISRQEAIDAFDGVKVDEENCTEYDIGYNDGIDFAVSKISALPSAQPKIKTGYWVPKDLKWECNHCGCRIRRANPFCGNLWNYYYCPNCGYSMNPLNAITSEVQNESSV